MFKFEAEVRLLRWSESSTAGRTITIELPPDAGEGHPFRGLPTGHQHGQRFRMQFSAIGDDETPVDSKAQLRDMLERSELETRPKDLDRSRAAKDRYADADAMEQARIRSALLAKDPQFQMWTGSRGEEAATIFIRRHCQVESRRWIATDVSAYELFLELETTFAQATGRIAESRR